MKANYTLVIVGKHCSFVVHVRIDEFIKANYSMSCIQGHCPIIGLDKDALG